MNNLFTYQDFFSELFQNDYDTILDKIEDYIISKGQTLGSDYHKLSDRNVWIHNTSKVDNNVNIVGPCIIMENVTIENNAVIRPNVIIGPNSHIGNSTEVKNSILLDTVTLPHFNYVGDSILGSHVHLGAGAIISNYRLDHRNVKETRMKIGAYIGDYVEVGCNSVICPGTIINKNVTVYPLVMVRGNIKENSIVKRDNIIVEKDNR